MLVNISIGRYGADMGIRIVLEKIWQLPQELDIDEIYLDCKQIAHIYMNERAVFDKTIRLWTAEMMRKIDQM